MQLKFHTEEKKITCRRKKETNELNIYLIQEKQNRENKK